MVPLTGPNPQPGSGFERGQLATIDPPARELNAARDPQYTEVLGRLPDLHRGTGSAERPGADRAGITATADQHFRRPRHDGQPRREHAAVHLAQLEG